LKLILPSAEQGKSAITTSNIYFSKCFCRLLASNLTISIFFAPCFSTVNFNFSILIKFFSFAIIFHFPFILAAICVDFQPGEAVKSKT